MSYEESWSKKTFPLLACLMQATRNLTCSELSVLEVMVKSVYRLKVSKVPGIGEQAELIDRGEEGKRRSKNVAKDRRERTMKLETN